MRLRELLLASGEWDWSAMGMRAPGEMCLVIAGVFVGAVDGSYLGNLRRGGSGRILRYGEQERMLPGGLSLTTNNRMEVMAANRRTALRRPGPATSRSSPIETTSAVG